MIIHRAILVLQVLLLMTAVKSASAHHSTRTTYDEGRTVEFTGTLVDLKLKSPHSILTVETTESDGSTRVWDIETRSLAQLRRRGWEDDTFKKGDVITVSGWPGRRPDTSVLFGREFIARDGTVITEGLPDPVEGKPPASAGVERIAGRWQRKPGAQSQERIDGSPLPLTSAGQHAWDNYDQALSPANTCEPVNLPAIFYAPYLYDIRLADDAAILSHEVYSVTRTIPLNTEPVQSESAGVFGLATARADGENLLIESTNFPPSGWGLAIAALPQSGNGADIPSSDQKRVIERYSVSEDGGTLRVDYTVEDPVYLSQPYSSHVEFVRLPDDAPMYPYPCEKESASRFSRSRNNP